MPPRRTASAGMPRRWRRWPGSDPLPARLAHWLGRSASLVSAAMFAAVFVVFVLKVALRYGLDVNLAWADEICSVLFIWVIFWANALVLPDGAQIRFDLVLRMLSPRGQRVAAYARTLLVGGLFAAGLPAAL